jgi:hypothetical protein
VGKMDSQALVRFVSVMNTELWPDLQVEFLNNP